VPQNDLKTETAASINVLDYFVLDVFTDTRLEGNQLAVFINPGHLTTERMQAIARETNLSETTFVQRRDVAIERREGVLVRIFTTEEELSFAGHPTLGTSSLLSVIAPEAVVDGTILLVLKVGSVPVRIAARQADTEAWPIRGEMTQRDPEFGEILDPEEVASLTGLSIEHFDPRMPIQVASTGTAFAIVPLRSADALRHLAVRQAEATAYLRARGARWFYVLGPEAIEDTATARTSPAGPHEAYPLWRARMQFNGGEDPATGSAAGCAISHLVHHGAIASGQTIHLRQGVEMLRPSDLYLSARRRSAPTSSEDNTFTSDVTEVRVGGSTILVAKGQLFLP
jgi:trans-2,3-dihydro-3-hydroxyanthranilate isomerase